MSLWSTTLRIGADMKLLVTSPEGDDLIKARLPLRPPHPRALLTMLEGIALFSGEPLCAVVSAGTHREDWLDSEQWCNDLWPVESPLIHFDFALPRLARAAVSAASVIFAKCDSSCGWCGRARGRDEGHRSLRSCRRGTSPGSRRGSRGARDRQAPAHGAKDRP